MSERSLLQQIGRTGRAMHAAFEKQVGIPLTRWRILQALQESGRIPQKDLAAFLAMDPGLLTRQMKLMESENLVKRQSAVEDNRMTLVELTKKGSELLDSLKVRRSNFSRMATDGLPGEKIEIAIEMLKAIEARFRP